MSSQNGSFSLVGQDIIYFSHDWSGDPLSKTHLARVLARSNRILWINSLANRTPSIASKDLSRIASKLRSFTRPIDEVEPNIFVLSPASIPAYGSEFIRELNSRLLVHQVKKALKRLGFSRPVNLVFNPAAGLIAGKFNEELLIYYCVDDYTAFTGAARGLKEIEEELFRRSDLVVVSAQKLFESKRQFNPNTHIIRHGTDWHHFRTALEPELKIPGQLADLPKPIIGFHGLLADWIDYELIRKIAGKYSRGSVALIGKIALDAESAVKALKDVPNVHFLGRKPYAELPAFCKGFDVAINPFKINDLTIAANPLKVREYLAAGLPVVSTDIPEVRILEDCLVGVDHDDFLQKLDAALTYPRRGTAISDSIKDESWEAKVEELREIVSSL